MTRRAVILVLDGVGIGAAPDAARTATSAATRSATSRACVGGLALPNLAAAGLGNIAPLAGVAPAADAGRGVGTDASRVGGEGQHDGTLGDRRAAPRPRLSDVSARLPPRGRSTRFVGRHGARGDRQRGRRAAPRSSSGSGRSTSAPGAWIVYTSADSVFQVAAHERVVPLDELYAACETARAACSSRRTTCRASSRVPSWARRARISAPPNRRDYSIAPPGETLLDALAAAGVPRAGVGKVDDLFAGRHLRARHTANNAEGIQAILEWLHGSQGGLLFANLVDFDTLYGHRNDAAGFERALREFDDALPAIRDALREDDLLFITADHGNDPTTASTDHARECVPLLVLGDAVHPVPLGERETFADLGATVAEWLNVGFRGRGISFLPQLERGR